MPRSRRLTVMTVAAGLFVVAAWPPATRAATNDNESPDDARAPRGLESEIIGVELPLLSGVLAQQPASFTENQSLVQAGAGIAIRVARQRGELAYVTPIAFGLFLASHTGYAHVLTEGGLILPALNRRLEIGAAIGVGVLRMTYASHCDGDCNVGGIGVMVAPVIRWLFISRPDLTVGASVRAVLPLSGNSGRGWFGDFSGFGSILLGGIEVGFGRKPVL